MGQKNTHLFRQPGLVRDRRRQANEPHRPDKSQAWMKLIAVPQQQDNGDKPAPPQDPQDCDG